jgi:hypothetical protein
MTIHQHWRVAFTVALALASALLAPPSEAQSAATGPARLTIASGAVQVLRGAQRFEAREGLTLADDDIVRTTAATAVARIEWPDGRALDLGPGTQALLPSASGAAAAGVSGASALLLQGWAKLAAGAAPARLALARVVLAAEPRGAVLAQTGTDGAAAAFAESRRVAVVARGQAAGSADATLREGEGWRLDVGAHGGRPAPRAEVLNDVPRALADALPRRFDRVAPIDAPADAEPIEAADLAPWQKAEPAWLAHAHPRSAGAARSVAPRAAVRIAASRPAVRVQRPSLAPAATAAVIVPGLPLPAPVSPTDFAPIEPMPALAIGAGNAPTYQR